MSAPSADTGRCALRRRGRPRAFLRRNRSSLRPALVLGGLCALGGALLCGSVLTGCATAQAQSTRLTADDIQTITIEMAERLRGSDFLRDRTPDSPRIIIAIQKVENLSTDLISEGERWYLMERVASSAPILALRQDRNIGFVLPAEKVQRTREVTGDSDFARGRAPTHEMTATLRSVTRSAGADRTDAYSCQYRITSLATGEVVWTDSFEFKRAAVGKAYD